MDVVLANTTIITITNIPSCNILFPAPPRFGSDGNPLPPRSNLVVVGIFSPSAAHSLGNQAAQPLPLNTQELCGRFPCRSALLVRLARVARSAVGTCRPQLSTPFPKDLVACSVDNKPRTRTYPRQQLFFSL